MALPPIQFLSNTPPPIDFDDDKDNEIGNDDVNFSNFEGNLKAINYFEKSRLSFFVSR